MSAGCNRCYEASTSPLWVAQVLTRNRADRPCEKHSEETTMTTDNRTNEPSEEQIERALDAISRFNQWTDNPRGAMRAALTAAGVASQEVIDDAADEQDDLRLHMLAPQEPSQNETKSGNNFVSLDPEKVAEIERAAAARARGEALIEVVQAHRDLHKTYGSTVACRGGIGGQALTSHCGEICYNADAHQKEMEAWQKLEVEAIDYSSARAAALDTGKETEK